MKGRENGKAVIGKTMIEGLRPAHWTKNVFLFAAVLFGGRFFSLEAWVTCGGLFIIFCGLAGAVYLINDMKDRDADKHHPQKRERAIASGRLSISLAIPQSLVLMFVSLSLLFVMDRLIRLDSYLLTLCGFLYVVINILYTFGMKKLPLVDVIFIALGFVIRVVAGALAIEVPVSPWLVVCTFVLALYIGIIKRRSEINEFPGEAARGIRQSNVFYTRERLERILPVSAILAIISYSLYCVSPQTLERVGSIHLVWTIPVVVYGIFRYYCISGRPGSGDPVQILLKDKGMWLTGTVWVILVVFIIYDLI